MTDAYCHLDMDAESPIADIEQRMLAANVSNAFLVETWDGRNRRMLAETDKFSVALCYRQECRSELLQLTGGPDVNGGHSPEQGFLPADWRVG